MNILKAEEFGIVPEKEIGDLLCSMFDFVRDKNVSHIVFQKGTYYIDSDRCKEHMLYITNTLGDNELDPNETPHLQKVAFYLNKLKNITIDGGNSVFIISGKMTNFVIQRCENITVKNLKIRHACPDMHRLLVKEKSAFHIKFEADKETTLKFKSGKPYFQGQGFSYPADKGAPTANWIPLIKQGNENYCCRVKHPLKNALKYEETEDGFLAYYLSTKRFNEGDQFYIYDVIRQYVGIFINECKNITLENVHQDFNYSLAVVLQCSENITIQSCVFAPEKGSQRLISSCADFIQASMCKGLITVKDCKFSGAGDDCMNVHGIHFKVCEAKKNKIKVKFMHSQTHGFNPFKVGDEIAFIDPKTLLEKARAKVLGSELLNENEIELDLDGEFSTFVSDCVENITACPDVIFQDNEISCIVTRGILITTRGKVQIKNNRFVSTAMSGVLISDDAMSWFESGMCKDVLIKDNVFEFCGDTPILIKPENKVYAGAVHENIRIIGNTFNHVKDCCIKAHSTNSMLIKNNQCGEAKVIKAKNCFRIEEE